MTSRNHRSAPGASDLQLIPPLGKIGRTSAAPTHPTPTPSMRSGRKGKAGEPQRDSRPAIKPEPKPQGKSPSEGGGEPGSNPQPKPEAKPGGKPPGQTPKEWTGPRTPGGKPAPSKPTGDYDVPTHRIIRWRGDSAPKEGSKSGGTSPADRARAQRAGERWGPPGHKWDAGHEKPASQTPPGERPYLRPEGSSENRSGGKPIADENRVRRQDPTHRDPSSPNYTREPRRKSPEPTATEAQPKSPEPTATEAQPKSPESLPRGPKSPESLPRGPKPPGGPGPVEGLARKLGPLGIVGEIQMVRDVAKELEWRANPSDPKWGNERTDMFGQTWYRSDVDKATWTTRPLPSA